MRNGMNSSRSDFSKKERQSQDGSERKRKAQALVNTNSKHVQEPRSMHLGGKISSTCKFDCCRSGNKLYSVLWRMDMWLNSAPHPCIAKLSPRKFTTPNMLMCWICNNHPQTCIFDCPHVECFKFVM